MSYQEPYTFAQAAARELVALRAVKEAAEKMCVYAEATTAGCLDSNCYPGMCRKRARLRDAVDAAKKTEQ